MHILPYFRGGKVGKWNAMADMCVFHHLQCLGTFQRLLRHVHKLPPTTWCQARGAWQLVEADALTHPRRTPA